MARNQDNFVPMAGPVCDVFELLESLVDIECGHKCNHRVKQGTDCEKCGHTTDKDGETVCTKVTMTGIEEAAVAIAAMIDKGELQ